MFFSRLPTSKFSLNSVCAQICAQLRHTPAHSSARTRLRSGPPTFQSLPGDARGCWLRPGAWVGISLGSEFEVAPASPGFARRSDRTSVASALVRVCHRLFGGWCLSLADYVTMRGPSDWAPAAEGARVAYAPCSSTVARYPRYRIFRIMSLGLAFSVTVHEGR